MNPKGKQKDKELKSKARTEIDLNMLMIENIHVDVQGGIDANSPGSKSRSREQSDS